MGLLGLKESHEEIAQTNPEDLQPEPELKLTANWGEFVR